MDGSKQINFKHVQIQCYFDIAKNNKARSILTSEPLDNAALLNF